ncbi:ABC transporter permease [Nonomuraea insulae]|uniref:Transport permease protein n=1 Tax=Nonomuraea insulae TaxID=1616787 RepID=A0ABW1D6Y7_9ACTN
MVHPSIAVLERHLLLYRRLWRASVFSFFVLPVLFLLSVGVGVGAYVSDVDHVSYLSWIAPALLASLAFQIGFNESTMGIYTDFEWIGAFHVMRNTRVRIRDMIAGWHLYVLVVLELAVIAFLLVTWAFGVLDLRLALAGPAVCALVALSIAAPTTAFSAIARDENHFHLLAQFGVLPATLVSGVFFPVDRLPDLLEPLAYVSPLWHGVELNRAVALGVTPSWPPVLHIAALLAWTVLGLAWAHRAFRRRLAD